MKYDSRLCTSCGGMGSILRRENVNVGGTWMDYCHKCNGEGFEVIITPRQWKEYQWLEKIADELEAKHIEVSDLKKKDEDD